MIVIVIAVIATVVVLYIVTSCILFSFPHLIHKRKTIHFQAKHISHRGGAGENIENTMMAFKHALNVGTEMLEIDCQITKDGEVVVSHDDHLIRISELDAHISKLAHMELPQLSQKSSDFDGIRHCTATNVCVDQTIPLLRDVFEVFPDTPINIDIKRNDDELILKVWSLIKEFHREHITVWGNLSKVIAEKLYKQDRSIPLIFSFRRVISLLLYYYTGLLPFITIKESFLEIPMPTALLNLMPPGTVLTKKMNFYICISDMILMSKRLFKHLKKRGIQTYLFVLNDEYQFQRAFKLGASGVMTDYPSKLDYFLKTNPQYAISKHSKVEEKTTKL